MIALMVFAMAQLAWSKPVALLLRADEAGTSMIEAAVLAPILLLCLVGAVDLGRVSTLR